MKITLGRLGSACCALLAATAIGQGTAHAGPDDKGLPNLEMYFGAYAGLHAVVGDWDLSYFADEGISPGTGVVFGLRVGLQATHWFAVEGEVGFVPFILDNDGGGLAMDWSLNTLWSPFDWKLSPYGLIGLGMYHSAYGDLGDDADWEFHYGGGIRSMMNEWSAFRIELRHIITDSYSEGSASNVQFTLGMDVWPWSYTEGEKDLDGDGLVGKDDDCPTVYGPVATRGCPDTDGDGIRDRDDRCPTQPRPPNNQGCPDTDGDGIRDRDDRCPTLPGPPMNQGCPDTDGDGIYDDVDECKTVPGVPEYKGCPAPVADTDGDGIPDAEDKCPTVKGLKELQGCLPTQEFANLKVEDILFVTGSAKLSRRSFEVLDAAVKLLEQYPTVLLDIHGHTDNQGPDEMNQRLSEDRAASVVEYLISKGVSRERLTSRGFGEKEPIAPNNTAEGRQKNRRTEFHIRTQ